MFIVSLKYKKDLSEVELHMDAHIEYLEKYFKSSVFIASGRKVPRTGGVILAHASSREELDKILLEDPFSIASVADYEIIQFVPSITAENHESLAQFI